MANKYNGAEDNRAKLKKASTEEELNDLLIQLDKEWNETKEKYEPTPVEELFPVEHGYTYKEYKPESDESIATRVENELRSVSESKKQQLRAAAQGEERKEESRRDEAEAENESQKKSIAKARKEEYDDIENAAVAQGIGRSSIKSDLEGEADRSAIAASEASDSELALKEAEIDANIAALREKLDAALQAEDADAAADIAERTADLIAERDKEADRVTEYNNKVKQDIDNYYKTRQRLLRQEIADYNDRAAAQAEYERKYGYTGEKQENYTKRLDLALDFYSGFDPDVAIEMIENNGYLRSYLGRYYQRLVGAIYSAAYGG